jgi:hypothetical protein
MSLRETVMSEERRARMEQHRLISAAVAGKILGVTSRRVLQMARAKEIPAVMVDDGYLGQFIFIRTDINERAKARRDRVHRPRRASQWGKAARHQPSYQRAAARSSVADRAFAEMT